MDWTALATLLPVTFELAPSKNRHFPVIQTSSVCHVGMVLPPSVPVFTFALASFVLVPVPSSNFHHKVGPVAVSSVAAEPTVTEVLVCAINSCPVKFSV